jgi:tetratricopeptide (TPR) repeat protein
MRGFSGYLKTLLRLLGVSGLLLAGWSGGALAAQEANLDDELALARKAWEDGDRLGVQALQDYQLLDKQEQAYGKAEEYFRGAIKKDPQNPHALVEMGRFLRARKEYGQARIWLERAEASPRLNIFPPAELAELHRMLGGLLERAGETSRAMERYRKAFACYPADDRNIISLAVAHCAAGKFSEAVALLRPWAEQKPQTPNPAPGTGAHEALGFYTLALALEENGSVTEALPAYARAEALSGKSAAEESNLVRECSARGSARMTELVEAWQARSKENATRLARKQDPLPDESANLKQACALCDDGERFEKLALADAAFVAALAGLRYPGAGEEGGTASATSLEDQPAFESFTRAMQSFQEAIARYIGLARAHYELAVCKLLLGSFSQTRQLLAAAAEYSPHNLAILQLQGEVLLELGQWKEAAGVFKKLLALEPESGRGNMGLARAGAGWQADEKQVRMALNALDRAKQLGVRDSAWPDLSEKLAALADLFARGEKPAAGNVIHGRYQHGTERPAINNDPWRDPLFEK